MNRRQQAFLAAKLIFATAVIIVVARKVDVAKVWVTVRSASPLPIALGIFLCFGTVAVSGWRWRLLFRTFQIEIPLRSLICIIQIGQFFAMFLPGPTGDDPTRMLYISRLAPGRVGEACSTVVLDRCIGLASVLALAVFCIPWQWDALSTSRQTHWFALAIVLAGVAVCIFGILFFIAGHPTHHGLKSASAPCQPIHSATKVPG